MIRGWTCRLMWFEFLHHCWEVDGRLTLPERVVECPHGLPIFCVVVIGDQLITSSIESFLDMLQMTALENSDFSLLNSKILGDLLIGNVVFWFGWGLHRN